MGSNQWKFLFSCYQLLYNTSINTFRVDFYFPGALPNTSLTRLLVSMFVFDYVQGVQEFFFGKWLKLENYAFLIDPYCKSKMILVCAKLKI